MNCSELLNVFLRLNYIASGWSTRPLDQFRLTSHLPMKMTCSFREGEVHFNWNVFEGILRLKRYISTVNTWNLSLYFFIFTTLFDCVYHVTISLQFLIFVTLETHPFNFALRMKLFTLATHPSLSIINHDNFFKNCLIQAIWELIFILYL